MSRPYYQKFIHFETCLVQWSWVPSTWNTHTIIILCHEILFLRFLVYTPTFYTFLYLFILQSLPRFTSPSLNSTSYIAIDQALAPQSLIDPSTTPILTSDIQPTADIQSPEHASAVDSFHNQPPVIPAPLIPHISPTISNSHPMETRCKHGIFKPKTHYKAQLDYTLTEPPTFKIATQISQWC